MTARTALITGGTRGIGLGIARALAAEGWRLILAGMRPAAAVAAVLAELEAVRGAIPESLSPESRVPSPHSVHYVAADLADPEARARLVEEARAGGPIHALINNAGRAPRVRADILEASEESFEELIRTNLQGPYFLTQAIARDMLEQRRTDPSFAACIVFVTSVSAEMVSINRGDYCVSKAGLSMAARLFAARLAGDGIPVYEVRPGVIATDMTARVKELYDRRIADGLIPEGRWGDPSDVGRIVASLVRGDAPYSTGTVINVDGGLSIPRL